MSKQRTNYAVSPLHGRRGSLTSVLGALLSALALVFHSAPAQPPAPATVDLRSTAAPLPTPSTSAKSPVIATVNPRPFDPCEDIPLEAIQRIGLAYTPPEPEEGLRCHYDAGNYQMAVEAVIWRTYEATLPADAVEFDINGHRSAQYWIMKPTDWDNRWWITCMIAFKTSYGVLQQSLLYSPIYSPDGPDCLRTNLQRAQQLSPYYVF